MESKVTLVAAACVCCAEPRALAPREDLGPGLAVCEETGRLYRPEGMGYVPTAMPDLGGGQRRAASVRIDLSRSGYA